MEIQAATIPFGYIYCATCTVNGKRYIGQSTKPKERWRTHKDRAKASDHRCHFHNAIKKHGWDTFEFSIIDQAGSPEELDEKERHCIACYQTRNPALGYNDREGGHNGRLSQESQQRRVATMREGYRSGRIRPPWLGKKRSAEDKAAMSKGHKEAYKNGKRTSRGRKASPETREKVARAQYRAVRCIETGEHFESIMSAAAATGLARSRISSCLRKKTYSASGQRWEYVNQAFKPQIDRTPRPRTTKPIRCVETGQMFESMGAVALWIGKKRNSVWKALKTGCRAGGYHWIRPEPLEMAGVCV